MISWVSAKRKRSANKALQKFHNTLSSNLQYYVITDVLWTPAFVMRKKGSYRKISAFAYLR